MITKETYLAWCKELVDAMNFERIGQSFKSKIMAKYKCNNENCKEFNKETTANTHIIYKAEGKVDKAAPCPACGEIREMIVDGKSTTVLAKGNPNICRK